MMMEDRGNQTRNGILRCTVFLTKSRLSTAETRRRKAGAEANSFVSYFPESSCAALMLFEAPKRYLFVSKPNYPICISLRLLCAPAPLRFKIFHAKEKAAIRSLSLNS